ncbi:MAG: alpha-mannosidase [Armatimonadetes bacterium]|nr:alpha-mannosidase [Armatimonadota bacterium]
MLKHPQLTYDRIRQFLRRELKDKAVTETVALKAEFGDGKDWQAIEPGFAWGPAYTPGWYRLRVKVPKAWEGREIGLCYGQADIWGQLEGSVEATIYQDGKAVGGLDWGRSYHRFADKCDGGESFELRLQTFAHNKETTCHGKEKPRTPEPEVYKGFWLVSVDPDAVALAYDVAFCLNLHDAFDEGNPGRAVLLRALNEVCNLYRPGQRRAVSHCRRIIKDAMDSLTDETHHEIVPVGHAHLDTAWLWPLSVTHLKMFHTTAVQLGLMERYPEYVFVHSQASQYEWLEQDQPELFERVRRAVRKGQWEVLGSMWVEADCNLTGSESLVRQFLYGKRYFREKFGVNTIDMWLPDVFGYSAALPQILTKFGIKAFLTQKLSWNQFNKLPHHTFYWQGIDGSRVWSHFPPADTYCASAEPTQIAESVRKFKDASRSDMSMYVFGWGDGGGGPTENHLEFLRRARQAPGLPVVASRKKAADFFEEAIASSEDLCTWVGELYFELHRGTYTSQAANKKSNRESEFLLRDAEWLAAFCERPGGYPRQALEEAWKLVLLNQFHDIIPGSSVREVYEDSKADYARVRQIGTKVIEECLQHCGGKLDTSDFNSPVAIFHNCALPSQVEMGWKQEWTPKSVRVGDESLGVQLVDDFGEKKLVFQTPLDALGAVAVGEFSDSLPMFVPRLKVASRRLENNEFAVRFDGNGNITSVQTLDDDPIEFITPGKLGNVLQLFDDHPLYWDAWDVDIYALETQRDLVRCESFEIVEKGPVRIAAEVVKKFGNSTVRQRISLGPTPGIRFDTQIDWHEEDKMLKAAFPVNVNAQRASFEIQFGHVERPTHRNTSWDVARFEVCAHKWVDMSEGGHGVALLNDGKYGHDVQGDTMRITLLRAPKAPDPTCDIGRHRFTYVLLPHYDQLQHSDVVAAAYALNSPARTAMLKPKKGLKAEMPRLIACDNRNVVIEAVKKAEDSELVVARLYECHNTRGSAFLQCAMPVKRAWLADLNETRQHELEIQEGAVLFNYKPFEILTVLLEL